MNQDILTVDQFLTPEECRSFIAQSEKMGYEPATIDTEKGPRLLKMVRDNNRILHNDPELAASLWEKIRPHTPARFGNSTAMGLNELFRFYKYGPGQQFKQHIDQPFIRNEAEASYYTFLIYLNDDYEGGETSFQNRLVKPRTGTALLFRHDLLHAGNEVTVGTKYVIRTDVMYRLDADEAG